MTSFITRDNKKRSSSKVSSECDLNKIFASCRSLIDPDIWEKILTAYSNDSSPEKFPEFIACQNDYPSLPKFIADLARIELGIHITSSNNIEIPSEVHTLLLNPTCQLVKLQWKNLLSILSGNDEISHSTPIREEEFILIWRDPATASIKTETATSEDLLVLKIAAEGIEPETVADKGNIPETAVTAALDRAVGRGILLKPRSLIRRDPSSLYISHQIDERFISAELFTLQWHITQACDLHCKHCYDRSERSPLKMKDALKILDDLYSFCKSRNVRGHVSFSGGNPLIYPRFSEIYRAASERGFSIAILGNPSSYQKISELAAIQKPTHFQLSLEGMPEHNDYIRGERHFSRTIEFLGILRKLNIYSMVMLTLTKNNIGQVIPLAEMLRDKTNLFNFNRLSLVGEGANLQLPTKEEYLSFLESYIKAAKDNPIMGLKDNIINIIKHQNNEVPVGGCTGFGCGAAFNFITVLSDGEVHACRKFPSLIGNIFKQSLSSLYDSEIANRYRRGTKSCSSCPIRPVCGGCLAIIYSHGLNVFEDRDPYCFINN